MVAARNSRLLVQIVIGVEILKDSMFRNAKAPREAKQPARLVALKNCSAMSKET